MFVGHSGTCGGAAKVVRTGFNENGRTREPRLLDCWRLVISRIETGIGGIRDGVEDLVKLSFSSTQRVRHFVPEFQRLEGIRFPSVVKNLFCRWQMASG